ncbi:MAG: hypothetical protein ACRDRN_20015, partial [Sciscionella sp.]
GDTQSLRYLRDVLYAGTHHVFLTLLIVALVTVVVLVVLTPRRFPIRPDQEMAAKKDSDP